MMGRKSVFGAFLIAITLLSMSCLLISLASAAWSDTEIISNSGEAPTIDGIMEETWSGGNVKQSYYEFSNGRRTTLYVNHATNYIYFLIEVKFTPAQINETISLYISSSKDDEDDDFVDKKQITMVNASQKGNESISNSNLHRNSAGKYLKDVGISNYQGDAAIGQLGYRYYEFKVELSPDNETENAYMIISQKYAVKVGLNNTASDEERSSAILIQVGPKIIETDEEIGEYDISANTLLYIKIILGISTGIIAIYGVWLILLKPMTLPEESFLENKNLSKINDDNTQLGDSDAEEESESKGLDDETVEEE